MKHLPVNVVITVVVAAGAFLAVRTYAPQAWGIEQLLGMTLLATGFVLWTVARFQLGASLTVTAQARKLVTTGLYSKIRNPIYVFGSCFLVGLILVIARPLWLLVFVLVVPFQIWRAGKEAKVLEASFGDEYRTYRAETWFYRRRRCWPFARHGPPGLAEGAVHLPERRAFCRCSKCLEHRHLG